MVGRGESTRERIDVDERGGAVMVVGEKGVVARWMVLVRDQGFVVIVEGLKVEDQSLRLCVERVNVMWWGGKERKSETEADL